MPKIIRDLVSYSKRQGHPGTNHPVACKHLSVNRHSRIPRVWQRRKLIIASIHSTYLSTKCFAKWNLVLTTTKKFCVLCETLWRCAKRLTFSKQLWCCGRVLQCRSLSFLSREQYVSKFHHGRDQSSGENCSRRRRQNVSGWNMQLITCIIRGSNNSCIDSCYVCMIVLLKGHSVDCGAWKPTFARTLEFYRRIQYFLQ